MKTFKDIVPNYQEYLRLQKEDYCSFESNNEHWVEGQKRYLLSQFEIINRNNIILDIACGDGTGLSILRSMGFKFIVGADVNPLKVCKAKNLGFSVFNVDAHKLDVFYNDFFNIVYSSHTLEHMYEPLTVVKEFHRILKSNGELKIVLPFPDTGIDTAHGGKYSLGTDTNDVGIVIGKISAIGFKCVFNKIDYYRENEIWLNFVKM